MGRLLCETAGAAFCLMSSGKMTETQHDLFGYLVHNQLQYFVNVCIDLMKLFQLIQIY